MDDGGEQTNVLLEIEIVTLPSFVNTSFAQVGASWQEQIRRKKIQAENSRKDMEREIAEVKTAVHRQEEAEARDKETAKAMRIETMLDNKHRAERRSAERSTDQQEKYRLQEQIRNDELIHKTRLEEKKKEFIS